MNNLSNSKKVIHGVSSQTLVTLVLGVVEIVSFSIMSRLLTKEDFGYYAAITAITAVFASFSETGIGSAIVQQKTLTKKYTDNAFTISLIFGGFLSLLLLSLSGILADSVADASMKSPLMLMSVTLLLNCLTSVSNSIMHRKLQFLRIGSINLFSLCVTTGIAVWLAYEGYGYYAIITKAVLSSVLTFILSFCLCNCHFSISFDIGTFKNIFSFSGWLMASVLFRNLAHQIDKLLMPRLFSIDALGSYNRPKEFVEQISTKLNGIFDMALFPVLSSVQNEKQTIKYAFVRAMYFLNIFAMLLTLLLVFNSSLIIRIFFGEKWLDLNLLLSIISCNMLLNIDGRLSDCFLRSLAMTKQQFYFRIFEATLNIVGVLIGFLGGMMGVALGVLITNSISKIVKILFVCKIINIGYVECLYVIASSWRFTILYVPIAFLSLVLLPNTVSGNVISAFVQLSALMLIFFMFPGIVGEKYKIEVHSKVKLLLCRICSKSSV